MESKENKSKLAHRKAYQMTTTYRGTSRLGGPKRAVDFMLPLSSGLEIPSLGFGTYRINPEKAEVAVSHALACGFKHVDCAPVYGNEKEVGRALSSFLKTTHRDKVFVTSKLWPTDQSPDDVETACRKSIADLGVGYLDLYLIHWPVCWKREGDNFHPNKIELNRQISLEATWSAMEKLVLKGLVRSIGFCNATAKEAKLLVENATIAPAVHQMEVHPGFAQTELRSINTGLDMVTTAYCPFGMPTRFSEKGFVGVAQHPFLKPLCEQTGFSPNRLLLNWNLDQNNAVIVKSEDKKHIEENAKAQKFALSESVRWMLNHFEDKVLQVRVMNPTGFRGIPHESYFSK